MRRIILVIAMIAVLLISGCDSSSSGGGGFGGSNDDENVAGVDFHVGSQGLVLKFMPNSPPREMYEGDQLDIVVEVNNKGVYEVNNGRLYLSGFDPNREYVNLDKEVEILSNLEGKSIYNPQGLISKTYTFTDAAVGMPNGVSVFPQTFKVTACYPYRTEASREICIDPDPRSFQSEEKVCQVSGGIDSVSFGTQGAPVAVSSVEQTISTNRVQFKINIQNVGGGTIFEKAKVGNCDSDMDRSDLNKVYISSVKFSNHELASKCEPNPVNLYDGQNGIAYCFYEGDLGDDAYNTLLTVMLDYGYRSSISQEVNIYEIP